MSKFVLMCGECGKSVGYCVSTGCRPAKAVREPCMVSAFCEPCMCGDPYCPHCGWEEEQ